MKNYSERKKYSIHNLVKLINERNKENAIKKENTEDAIIAKFVHPNGEWINDNMKNDRDIQGKKKKKKKKNHCERNPSDDIHDETFDETGEESADEKKNELRSDDSQGTDLTAQNVESGVLCKSDTRDEEEPFAGSSIHPSKCKHSDSEDDCSVDKAKLFMIDYNECQNKKCSCKKLYRFKKIKRVQINKKFKGIVLTPFCDKYFSVEDKKIVETHGLSVIDCSWKSIDLLKKIKFSNQRKLPYIIAVNSINYGKPYKLSCLESLAFCLYICNYGNQCRDILNIYKWSSNFTNVNKELLEKYKLCTNHEDVKNAEREFIQNSLNEREENKKIDHYTVIYEEGYI
ncbi:ribosome biogenesis protein TSR3, putative (TSR3) [Plasmodium ovale wallikeri]|uniref:18S rRNA aminocarboxypropyltransferase n=1 Tax=Plasmodium ovale wallikeri TaxID=864142 RepID=A0A1A8ZXP5_PLAOA|nr:ribosome biogenesis protein TSR3, putative (TSR3) [Plasmodium ovale wallikeri]SBT49130.1 ribosome biogenesis protein TSR3, putative (TSR3) [Plasmodium ovale wallikeri]